MTKGSYVILLGAMLIGLVGCQDYNGNSSSTLDAATQTTMQDIKDQVAADAVKQYNIAKRSGGSMDTCVQAGMVAAAYLQAQDESSYRRWKATEKSDCAAAGLSP